MNAMAPLRLLRFSVVGLFATVTHVAIAFFTQRALGAAPVTANAVGFACAFLISYFGHHRWTFARRGNHRTHLRRFLAVSLIAYLVSHLITIAVTGWFGLSYEMALAAILVAVPATTYLASNFWAFAELSSDAVTEVRQPAGWPVTGLVLAATITAAGYVLLRGTAFNHDTSWYLIATRMWMDGAPLYSGIMEINPPLPFYVTRLALWLADVLGLSDADAFRLFLFATIAMSTMLAAWVLRFSAMQPAIRTSLLAAMAAALVLTPLDSFGQREHIFLITLLPYLFAVATGRDDTPHRSAIMIAVTLFALPGLLLKPHFLAVPLFVTAIRVIEQRSLKPLFDITNIIIATSAVLYLAAITVFHGDYLKTVVPLGSLVYGAYGRGTMAVLMRFDVLAAALAFALLMSAKIDRSQTRFARTLLAALAALAVVYLVQFKGFRYHAMPLVGLTLIASIWFLLAAETRRARACAGLAVVLMALTALAVPIDRGPYHRKDTDILSATLGSGLAGTSAMVFSTNVYRAFPLVNQKELRWTSRYPAQWIVPGAFVGMIETPQNNATLRARYAQALDFARQTATDDFVENHPDIVIVDTRERKSYFKHHDFDWIAFMRGDPAFAEAWQAYRLHKAIPDFEIWMRADRS